MAWPVVEVYIVCRPGHQREFHEVNRVIHKVRKTQHQKPEFGHTQDEIHKKKKPTKKYISMQLEMKLRKPSILVVKCVSSCLSSFLSVSSVAVYIFTPPNCTTTTTIS